MARASTGLPGTRTGYVLSCNRINAAAILSRKVLCILLGVFLSNFSGQPPAGDEATASQPGSRSFWSDAYGPLPLERRARESTLVLIQLENSLLKRLLELQA